MKAIARRVGSSSPEYVKLLRLAFDQICNPDDWKAPIDCTVPLNATSLYHEAIIFMTGTVPVSERLPTGEFRMTAIGYRAGPCGDH